MWSFDLAINKWSYVSGSQGADTGAIYPNNMGEGGPTYTPGSRQDATFWTDQASKKLWLFGGNKGYI